MSDNYYDRYDHNNRGNVEFRNYGNDNRDVSKVDSSKTHNYCPVNVPVNIPALKPFCDACNQAAPNNDYFDEDSTYRKRGLLKSIIMFPIDFVIGLIEFVWTLLLYTFGLVIFYFIASWVINNFF